MAKDEEDFDGDDDDLMLKELHRLLVLGKILDDCVTSACRFQRQELPTYSNITKLDLYDCELSSLPNCIARVLPNLSILFLAKNCFDELPAIVGKCCNLQMIGFKSNHMKRIHVDALQSQLRWLILTDNEISELPIEGIERCSRNLQKCMLSGNKIRELPITIRKCHKLELIRLASNQIQQSPIELLKLPNLRWIALSDNPFINKNQNNKINNENNNAKQQQQQQQETQLLNLDNRIIIPTNMEEECEVLGRGAGGTTYKVPLVLRDDKSKNNDDKNNDATITTTITHDDDEKDRFSLWLANNSSTTTTSTTIPAFVAIKSYDGKTMTSDGLPQHERMISSATAILDTDKIVQVLGEITVVVNRRTQNTTTLNNTNDTNDNDNENNDNNTNNICLVMEYLDGYKALASPPSFDSCSRDVYPSESSPSLLCNEAIEMCTGLLHALQQLHTVGNICHGDLYGHNILYKITTEKNNNNDNDDNNNYDDQQSNHHDVRKLEYRLSDFGAAFFYDRQINSEYGKYIELTELRAFAVLVEEIISLIKVKKIEEQTEDEAEKQIDYDDYYNNTINELRELAKKATEEESTTTTTTTDKEMMMTFDKLDIWWKQKQLAKMAKQFVSS